MERRNHPALALMLAAVVATGCATTPSSPAGSTTMLARANAARALLQAGDYPGADRAWSGVLADPRFDALPDERRGRLLSDAGDAATAAGDHDRARGLLLRAVGLAPSNVDAWWRLSFVELRRDDPDAAATALARIVLVDPGLVDNLDADLVGYILGEADPDGLPRLDLLQALFDAGWTRGGLGVDYLWVDLAARHVESGEAGLATRVVERIDDPAAIVELRIDRRFDAVVDRDDPRFDVAAAMQRKLERLRALSAAQPRWLEARNFLGFALLEAGDAAAALADANAILAMVAAAPDGAPPFDDMDELSWTGNTRAIALRRLGRLGEAAVALRDASRMGEGGGANVSQVLNLGAYLCGLGRWQEALDTIETVGEMSGYGRMVEASVAHCAAIGLGDAAAAATALDYLRAHRDDGEVVLLDALLEAGRVDDAAEVVIAQLQDPRTRRQALLAMQGFREAAPLPANVTYEAAWDALLARPDVQAAVGAVGRIEQLPIHAEAAF